MSARPDARVFAFLAFFAGISACGGPASVGPKVEARAGGAADEKAKANARADVDYVAIGSKELLSAIEPLLAFRETRGHVVERIAVEDLRKPGEGLRPEEIMSAIRGVAARSGERLRFVLLVGDVPGEGEDAEGFVEVPTLYGSKLGYENHKDDEHPHDGFHDADEAAHLLRQYGMESFPTDHPYAFAHIGAPGRPELASRETMPLAVGRVPARTPVEAAGFARKVIDYETSRSEGTWRRSIALFSGPANFGAFADFLIESTMTRTLDEKVPYDWDVDVIFPKLGSPYAYPFRDLSSRLVSRLGEGALIAGYVGHGAPTHFDDVHFHHHHYEIGSSYDLARLQIGDGKPFFVSITCNTGYFDLPGGDMSVAEMLVLNPGGAIAAFASSRESHPYPNALYGDAIVKTFVDERPPTLGEGVLLMKRRMREGDMPIAPLLFQNDPDELAKEHEGLYNLFGDPATALRYPAKATLSIEGGDAARAPGAQMSVLVSSKEISTGKALFTLETKRSVVRVKSKSAEELAAMSEDEAFEEMRKTYAAASDKVISRAEVPVADGRAIFNVKVPAEAGDYAVKVFVAGGGEAATGSLSVTVAAPK